MKKSRPLRADSAFERRRRELSIGDDRHALALGTVARVLLLAVVTATLFGSQPLENWVFELPLWLGPVREELMQASNAWHGLMVRSGLASVYPALRETFQAFQYWH